MESEWRNITLKNAVEFVVDNRGKTVPICESGIPLIATNCVSNDDLYPVHKNVRYVSHQIYKSWFRAHPRPNDILLTNKGSQNGAICLVPEALDTIDMIASIFIVNVSLRVVDAKMIKLAHIQRIVG